MKFKVILLYVGVFLFINLNSAYASFGKNFMKTNNSNENLNENSNENSNRNSNKLENAKKEFIKIEEIKLANNKESTIVNL